ncbi:hypothetical protein [Methanimicrococcus blatticola]|nr:hypothetical protein [Methanimicrococcus blatticola]
MLSVSAVMRAMSVMTGRRLLVNLLIRLLVTFFSYIIHAIIIHAI